MLILKNRKTYLIMNFVMKGGDYMPNIRTALKVFRIKQHYSQETMAKALGFSRNQYQRIENGAGGVSMKFIVALSEVFKLSLEEAKEMTKRDDEE